MVRRILLVEDNPTTRKLVRIALEKKDYKVLEAPTAQVALEMMAASLPDLVLQDLLLPDMHGIDLISLLRAIPGAGAVPILAFSGFISATEESKLSEAGFDDVIFKPIEPSRLVQMIEGYLPLRHSANRFGRGRRLLLVDDDPAQLEMARFRLDSLGFKVETAMDGVAALTQAKTNPPDVILSDVLMPRLDGFGLCIAVRQDAKLEQVPVVLVTSSYVERNDRDLARRAGANDLALRTPDLKDVCETLRKCLAEEAQAPPALLSSSLQDLEHEHSARVVRQLEKQVALHSGVVQRCATLATELSILRSISDALARHTDLKKALNEALATCLDTGGISRGALYLKDGNGRIAITCSGGFSTDSSADLESFFGQPDLLARIVNEGKSVVLSVGSMSPESAAAFLNYGNSILIVPVLSRREPLGALVFASNTRDLGNADWLSFAAAVAGQIGQAVALSRAFERVTATEQRHRALMENASDAIATLDLQGVIRDVNRRWEEILVLPKERIIGRHIREFAAPGREEENVLSFQTVVATGYSRGNPIEIKRSDGSRVLIEFSTTTLDFGGERVAFSIGRDVTEQLRTQAQLMVADRMVSVGTLAAGVAHEINNPLAAVMANLDLATREVAELAAKVGGLAELQEELQDARNAAERVRQIVRDLKIFSRSEDQPAGPVDVERILDSSLRMAWNEIRHRARLTKNYGKVPAVAANESRLGQVFLNLIVNAVQALPDGLAETNEIRIVTRTAPENQVVIEVIDTGPGISSEVLSRLFTPFFTTKPVGVGTGLGLSICHRIVTGFGGTIGVDSQVGKGTTFRVSLPIAIASAEVEPPIPPIAVRAAARRGRILVIDDEVVIVKAVQRILIVEHDVITENDAHEVLRRIQAGERYDVILCDLMMPQLSGMDLHDEILKVAPEQAACMIFLTGGAFTTRARAFLDATPNQRVEKPFDPLHLRALINDRIR